VLSTIVGPGSREPLSINEPRERFARRLGRTFKGVRAAWFKDLGGVPFDPRVRSVVDGHRKTFESLGCIVEQAEPDFAPAEIAFIVHWAGGGAPGRITVRQEGFPAESDSLFRSSLLRRFDERPVPRRA
jgi:amidase